MKKLLGVVLGVLLAVGLSACGGSSGDDGKTNPLDNNTTEDVATEDGTTVEEISAECAEKCGDKVCGEVDGCVCGKCKDDETCSADGKCEAAVAGCEDKCAGKECGTVDDCACGTCEAPAACNETTFTCECESVCEDANTGDAFECGDDGCGEPCGECPAGDQWACTANKCECTPSCDGKACGGDGCGGECGTCADPTPNCTPDGTKCVEACAEWDFTGSVTQKVNAMAIGKGGHPGEALDVDGDPDTCAPADDCEGGLNNQLSGLLGQLAQFVDADAEIAKALDEGSLIMLAENKNMKTDCTEFEMNMFIGEALAEKTVCDFQTALCEFCYKPESLVVDTCKPLIAFPNAKVCDGKLTAGGPEQKFAVSVPISDGVMLTIVANMASMVGDVTGADDAMKIENGIIGAAVRKDAIMEAVDKLPPDVLAELPVSIDMIKNLLNMFIVPDVDTDGDDEMDGASVGVKFGTIAAKVTGACAE
jgi:hypothetical protein